MVVELYYVKGITRIDTPYFATQALQRSWFTARLVKSIDTAFYPPHYHNLIRLDSSDIEFTSSVNYLGLQFKDKWYYYFIDDIKYSSEDVIELSIFMDTIQTYFFNIKVRNAIIERKFIDRYSDGSINRNYLRENVSSGEFIPVTSKNTIVPFNIDNLWNVVKVASYSGGTFDKYNFTTEIHMHGGITDGKKMGSSIGYGIGPNIIAPTECSIMQGENSFTLDWSAYRLDIGATTSASTVEGVYLYPFNPTSNMYMSNDTLVLRNLYSDSKETAPDKTLSGFYPCIIYWTDSYSTVLGGTLFSRVDIKTYDYQIDLTSYFIIPSTFGPYDTRKLPVMLDSNYIRVKCGNISTNTTFPLEYLTTRSFYFHYFANIQDGTTTFYCTQAQNASEDKYNTEVIDTNVVQFDLLNDKWKDYIAANKGRILAGMLGVSGDSFSSYSKIAMGDAYNDTKLKVLKGRALAGLGSTKASRATYNDRMERYKLEKISANEELSMGIMNAGLSYINNLANTGAEIFNNYFAPSSLARMGDNIVAVFAKEFEIFYQVYKVRDYDQCAMYYHKNGYLVNEPITNIDNIFSYVRNRQIFNVLKMKDINMYLENIITDDNTIDTIVGRLEDGLRLWNTGFSGGNTMGIFSTDNLEISAE